jgi:hypothetical protein
MAVVGCGGEEQAVLETMGEVVDSAGQLAGDRIARAARWCDMVRLVENEEGARAEFSEDVAQPCDVSFVGQQAVRDEKARAGGPGIDREAALAPQLADALAIDDVEGQAEFAFELVLPLHDHGGRWGNHN